MSYLVNHFASQNDKVSFDCLVVLDMYKKICPNYQSGFFYAYHFWVFLLENPTEKTMNCSSDDRLANLLIHTWGISVGCLCFRIN